MSAGKNIASLVVCHASVSPSFTEFQLTDEIKAAIGKARQNFDSAVQGLDLNAIEYTKMGKNFIKKQKLSPDSFMQLAIQVSS